MFANNVAIIWLQRYGSMVVWLYGVMGFGAKKKIGWSELVLPVREGIPEKNLAFGHCRKWGGEPPAQIDFDTFLKANKLLK